VAYISGGGCYRLRLPLPVTLVVGRLAARQTQQLVTINLGLESMFLGNFQ